MKYLELIIFLRYKLVMIVILVVLKGWGGNVKGVEVVLDEVIGFWDFYMGDEDWSFMLENIF